MSKGILNKPDTDYLRLRKIEVEGVAVIEFRVNCGGGDGTSCFKIKIRTNTTKLTNMKITRFRQCRDLVRESEILIENKAKIASRVSGIKRSVLYFSKLLSVTNEEKLCLREVKSQQSGRLAVIHEKICSSALLYIFGMGSHQ